MPQTITTSNQIIYKNGEGNVTWYHLPGDFYEVTGVDVYGKRFRIVSNTWWHAEGINLYRGTKWLVRNGKRYKIQSVYN